MKTLRILTLMFTLAVPCFLTGCGDGDPNAGGGPLPTTGLNNDAGEGEEDPNGGVGFDDESLGQDGQ